MTLEQYSTPRRLRARSGGRDVLRVDGSIGKVNAMGGGKRGWIRDNLGAFLQQYQRKAQRGAEPNDRHYDRNLENVSGLGHGWSLRWEPWLLSPLPFGCLQ